MADPRFFANRGPFTLAEICVKCGIAAPADGRARVFDLASLGGAGPGHLTFFFGGRKLEEDFTRSRAGFCLVPDKGSLPEAPPGMMLLLASAQVGAAWVAVASLFYPDAVRGLIMADMGVSADASLGANVVVGPHACIGAGAEIGAGTRIGAGSVIGPGVAIGRDCEIGAHVSISHAYLGDRVRVLPGARIGQPGFGFAPTAKGQARIPQLGRVIVQDDVDIGANTTIDRGALGDTVIGEGSKIDNLVQIAHNVEIGRHCTVISQVGIAGSSVFEDFVVAGGQVGIGDHVRIGQGARLGARAGVSSGLTLEGGRDYSGFPVKPIREWAREILVLGQLARKTRKVKDD